MDVYLVMFKNGLILFVVILLLVGGCSSRKNTKVSLISKYKSRPNLSQKEIDKSNAVLAKADVAFQKKDYFSSFSLYKSYIRVAGYGKKTEKVLFRLAISSYHIDSYDYFFDAERNIDKWFFGSSYINKLVPYHWKISYARKKFRKATELIKQLLKTDLYEKSREQELRFILGDIYEKKLLFNVRALNQYLAVLILNKPGKYIAESLYRLSILMFRANKRELALHYINRLIKEYPKLGKASRVNSLKRSIRWRYITVKEGLGDNSISSILFDEDDVWIGTWLGGLSRFTRSSNKGQSFKAGKGSIKSNLIRKVVVLKEKVWVATFGGLFMYDKMHEKWSIVNRLHLYNERIKDLLIADGQLWVATLEKGLLVQDLKTGSWKQYTRKNGLPGNNIVAFCKTPSSIWVGSVVGGIGRLDLGTGQWTIYKRGKTKNLPSNNIKSIAFDGTRVWFGTHGSGVVSCAEDGSDWCHFSTKNSGLTGNYVYKVAISPTGKIWFGMLEKGVCSYDSLKKKWQSLGLVDGLLDNDIITIEFEGRYIWFGTLNRGVAVLLTDEKGVK